MKEDKLPNIANRRAIYVEAREARAVIINALYCRENLIEFRVKADLNIPHMRVWGRDDPYIERKEEESEWTLSTAIDSAIIQEDFAQGPIAGWQLLISEETVEKFSQQDDSWVEDWF
ncbi:MAG: hypothetical protein ACFBSF_21560 [Leptolyngbyaceae cyanobacterium]